MNDNSNVTLVDHPLIARNLTILRDKTTPPSIFREAMGRISMILAYHALKELPLQKIKVQTPITEADGYKLDSEIVVVPILRAGLSLVDSIITFIPEATVGHLGLYRDEETKKPVQYYYKMPSGMDNAEVILVDPMLATGGSAIAALDILKEQGARKIRFMCLIAAPEGIDAVYKKYPQIPVITASIDEHLNENKFIVPGLGDAGDRYFGTI